MQLPALRVLAGPVVLALVAARALAACGPDSSTQGASDSDILNGSPSSRPEVVLLASSKDKQACSGTILAPDVILTAAHCLGDLKWAYVGYSKATTDRDTPLSAVDPDGGAATWRRYEIVDSAALPGFIESGCPMVGTADVALLRLKEPIADVTPATLADVAPAIGDECEVVGYGRHNPDQDAATNEKENRLWSYNEQRSARVTILALPPLLADGGEASLPDAAPGGDGGALPVDGDGGPLPIDGDGGALPIDGDGGVVPVDGDGDGGASADGGPETDATEPRWISAKGIDGAHSKGDSGGALFCGGKLAGVVSCSPNRDDTVLELVKVYGNVQVAKAFIASQMSIWAATPLTPSDDAGAEAGGATDDASFEGGEPEPIDSGAD